MPLSAEGDVKLAKTSQGYRRDIDGLRAIAIIPVVIFHAGFDFLPGGYIGVDVFFVISGYLITKLICSEMEARTFSFSRFYARRARRLFPALFVAALFTMVGGYLLFSPTDYTALAQSAIYATLSISNFLFWMQSGYFDADSIVKPLLHTWSLSVEEQYYLIWPALLFLLTRFASKWLLFFFMVSLVVASTVAAEIVLSFDWSAAAYFLLPFRIAELAIGGALALFPIPLHRYRLVLGTLSWTGLVMIAIAAISFDHNTPFPGINALLPCIGAAFVIAHKGSRGAGRILSHPALVFLGKISYSWYLLHWPIVVFAIYYLARDLNTAESVAVFLLSAMLATLSYYFVEQPFRSSKKQNRLSNPGFGLTCALLALLMVFGAANIWAYRGVPSRFGDRDDIQSLLDSMSKEKERVLGEEFRRRQSSLPSNLKSIVVIGDSHASVLWRALAEWGLKNGYRVEKGSLSTRGGCPGLLNVFVHGDKGQSLQCNANKDEKIRRVAEREHDIVVLASRWGLYTSRVTALDPFPTQRPRSLTLSPDRTFSADLEESRNAFVAGLQATVDLFRSHGAHVIFFGQVPPLGPRLEPCISRQASAKFVARNCAFAPFEEVYREVTWASETAKAMARPGFDIVDPMPLFCEGTQCQYSKDGKMLYTDGDHISIHGGRMVVSAIAQLLKAKE